LGNIPILSFLYVIYSLDFSYIPILRSTNDFEDFIENEFDLIVPVMLKLRYYVVHVAGGVQVSAPFISQNYEKRANFDLGIALEVGLQIKRFAFDLRTVASQHLDSYASGSLVGIGVAYLF